jgi:hypothetical protein
VPFIASFNGVDDTSVNNNVDDTSVNNNGVGVAFCPAIQLQKAGTP